MNQYDREEEQLADDLRNGRIDQAEYNRQFQALQRDYREAAQEAAERAYENEMERW